MFGEEFKLLAASDTLRAPFSQTPAEFVRPFGLE
jgi:hypothetical protein